MAARELRQRVTKPALNKFCIRQADAKRRGKRAGRESIPRFWQPIKRIKSIKSRVGLQEFADIPEAPAGMNSELHIETARKARAQSNFQNIRNHRSVYKLRWNQKVA